MHNYGEIGVIEQDGFQVMGFLDWSLESMPEYGQDEKWLTVDLNMFKLKFDRYWASTADPSRPVQIKLYKLVGRDLALVYQRELTVKVFPIGELAWTN